MNNLAKAIQRPGYRIDNMVYGLVPLGNAVLTQEEKEMGVMLVDLGGETMSVGIYLDGMLRFSRDIPYGCDLITRDLSCGLRTSRQHAQEIKEKYGVCEPTSLDEDGEIPVPSLDGRTVHNIKKSFILDIIQPRMEELLEYVRRSVEQSETQNEIIVIKTGYNLYGWNVTFENETTMSNEVMTRNSEWMNHIVNHLNRMVDNFERAVTASSPASYTLSRLLKSSQPLAHQ